MCGVQCEYITCQARVGRVVNISRGRHVWDVSSAVTEGDNTLRISFQSAVLAARARAEQEEVRFIVIFLVLLTFARDLNLTNSTPAQLAGVAPSCVPAEYHGECHANLVRKMQGRCYPVTDR